MEVCARAQLPAQNAGTVINALPKAAISGILRNLSRARTGRAEMLERLSNGVRINRAADDAAGLGVSTRLNADLVSLRQARRNAENGQSALSIAEGGLSEIAIMLTRMRELAMASASETHDDSERMMAQREYSALLAEIDRIAWASRFNDQPLLAKTHVDVAFVIDTSGSMGGEIATLTAEINAFRQEFIDAGLDVEFGLAAMRANIGGGDGLDRTADIADPAFEAKLAGLGIAGSAVDPYSALLNASGADDWNGDGDAFTWREDAGRHIVLITDTYQEAHLTPGDPNETEVIQSLLPAGVAVHVIAQDTHHDTYDDIASQTGGSLHDIGNGAGSGIPSAMDSIAGALTGGAPVAAKPLSVQVGIHDGDGDTLDIGVAVDATRVGLGVADTSVATAGDAAASLEDIDDAIHQMCTYRSEIGAIQNRLDHVMGGQDAAIVNEGAALSRIQDLDYAEATSELALDQALASAATTTLFESLRISSDQVRAIYSGLRRGGFDRPATGGELDLTA